MGSRYEAFLDEFLRGGNTGLSGSSSSDAIGSGLHIGTTLTSNPDFVNVPRPGSASKDYGSKVDHGDDGDNGHGSDVNRVDSGNPGKGKALGLNKDRGEDGNNGHGNNQDGFDESNPGNKPVEELPSLFTVDRDVVDFNNLLDSTLAKEVAAKNPNDGMHDALAGDDIVHLADTAELAAEVGYDNSIIFDGGAGNDQIFGGDHVNSFITGGDGDDYVYGGQYGKNKLYGGDGDDILVGGREHDTLYGEAGNDHLMGGQKWASDTLYGGAGDDELEGGGGNDFLYGGADNDLLRGGDGNDTLDGGAGADKLYGNLGNDILDGGAGNDLLYGDLGNDVLNGGEGNDRVWGQGGNDTLVFTYGESNGADRYDGGEWGYDIFRVEVDNVLQLGDILSDLHDLQDSIDSSTEFGVASSGSWGNQENVYLGSMGVYVIQVEEIQVLLDGSNIDWAGF